MAMQVAVALLALSVLASGAAAQSQSQNPPACASNLVPCAPYINGTGPPPESCCGPLKDAVKNDLPCLCDLYASPEIFKAFNINLTDALGLSKRCGVSDTTTACSGSQGKSPPGSPSGGGSGSGSNGSHRTLSVGVPSLMSLFLALWSVLA